MRVWDIQANVLCNNHLLGEHREIHAIWKILTKIRKDMHVIQKLYVGKGIYWHFTADMKRWSQK